MKKTVITLLLMGGLFVSSPSELPSSYDGGEQIVKIDPVKGEPVIVPMHQRGEDGGLY
ncbi:hypothetical protein NC661_19885 [Aquibacillus koreensis]|uniref:Uncharacterized protein n=1 Tax=Aquibacillus koreensis TaxID=279446 RepID=A0A9X4AJV4_9BACI|nr:hypothetical protein [Aquibacillus koreensis]MCT2536664.1 hypothetical protein [Aquibacillus koreensis]MDC3422617.1 hypothetical protein [Aquibacillus koreensis]